MLFEIKGTGTNSVPETKDSTTDTEKLKKDARAKGEYIVTISGDEKGLTAGVKCALAYILALLREKPDLKGFTPGDRKSILQLM